MEENEHTATVQRLMFTLIFFNLLQLFTAFLPLIAQIVQCLYV